MKNLNKLLIVEDERPLASALKGRFESEQFEVHVAHNGEVGLSVALDVQPDIVLLDLLMPRMDGISFLEKLRENPVGKDMKVIVLTNLNDSDKVEQVSELGAENYLVKTDWTLDDIVKKVKEKLL